MNSFNLKSMGAGLLLALGFALPAAAQQNYNFGNAGNCNFPPATCSVGGSGSIAGKLTISGWAAAAGANFVAATITDQNASGVGINSDGNAAPNHAIDGNGNLELILLNFNNNNVVLNNWTTGWSQEDTDVSLLRWVGGASGPTMTSTQNFTGKSAADLLTLGWQLVRSVDMDVNQSNTNNPATVYGSLSANSNLTVNPSNSSSWWIVSAYFGGSSSPLNAGNDYFKLLQVNATCVGSTSGGACNTSVPEPTSLALAGLALAGLGYGRRRKKVL